ncbi:MAG: TAXI family TRAP transporter solute-binding subunit [Tissierellales bacterium]|nr:TAXI family TRAP transporter solute-binding subunit [Tissierellales bacterium]
MKTRSAIIILIITGAVCKLSLAAEEYVIATGNKGALYYHIGEGIAKIAKQANPPIQLNVLETFGSLDNIKMLNDGTADFALIQGNLITHLHKTNIKRPFSILAALYLEPLQICIRKSICITNAEELKGKKISLGVRGSGTEPVAMDFLGASGISLEEITPLYLDFEQSIEALNEGTIDAALFVTGAPNTAIFNLISSNKIYLLSLDAHAIQWIRDINPNSILCEIPKSIYPRLQNNINTIGITACLACSDGLQHSLITNLLNVLYKKQTVLANYFPELEQLDVLDGIQGILPETFHPEAIKFYNSHHVFTLKRIFDFSNKLYPALLLIIFFLFFYVYKINIARFVERHEITRNFGIVVLGILFVLIPTGVALFYLEHDINDGFSSIWESMWSIIVYLVSGFENRAPITTAGRFITIFSFIIAAVVASFFTAILAALQIQGVFMRNEKIGNTFQNHVVILGWNEMGAGMIRELLKWGKYIAVMAIEDKAKLERLICKEDYYRVRIIQVDDFSVNNLSRLKLHMASAIVILSASLGHHSADDHSLIIMMCVRKILSDLNMPQGKPHIIVEVRDVRMKDPIKLAGADEIVCTGDVGQNLLANCSVNPGISIFFTDLLTMSDDTNEIYVVNVPEYFFGQSYNQLNSWLINNTKKDSPITLVGIQKANGTIDINPKEPEKLKFSSGDKILAMAYNKASLRILDDLGKR